MKVKKYENHFGPKPEKTKVQKNLDYLQEQKIAARINYSSSEKGSYLGRISGQDNQKIYLLPYLIFENLPAQNDEIIQRVRLETKIVKPLPKKNISSDPLSEGYLEFFAKSLNYFSSQKVSKSLRDILFNKKIYIMPTKKEITLFKTQLNSKK